MSVPPAATFLLTLAGPETPPAPVRPEQATTWLVALIVIILAAFAVAGIVVYIVRSRVLKAQTTPSGLPLTLADVRRMRERGEIDDEEMARLKGIVTGRAKLARRSPGEGGKDLPKSPTEEGTKTE